MLYKYFDEEKFKCFILTYKNNGGDLRDLGKAIYSNFKNKSKFTKRKPGHLPYKREKRRQKNLGQFFSGNRIP